MSAPSAAATDAAVRRYSTLAILLHWAIAALIVTNVLVALKFDDLKGAAFASQMGLHQSIGITVLLLSLARLLWRLVHRPPPMPARVRGLERLAAHAVHWGFYVLMIGIPLTGWIVVSVNPHDVPIILYKTIHWPHIADFSNMTVNARKDLDKSLGDFHQYLAWSAILLMLLHIAAALKHQFASRDQVLWRMLPIPGLRTRSLNLKDA